MNVRPTALGWAGRGLAALGSILLLVATLLDVTSSGGDYFTTKGVAIALVILLVSALVLVVLSLFVAPAAMLFVASVVGGVAFGLAYFVPLALAFHNLKELRAGGILAPTAAFWIFVGSMLALVSTGALQEVRRDGADPGTPIEPSGSREPVAQP